MMYHGALGVGIVGGRTKIGQVGIGDGAESLFVSWPFFPTAVDKRACHFAVLL